MKSRASTVLALAAIALLLLSAWWWLRAERVVADVDERNAASSAESEPQTASLEQGAALGDPTDDNVELLELARASRVEVGTPGASSIRLRVRSSVGLPLARVEVLDRDGFWQPHACTDGIAVLTAAALPLEARAPGHAARRFEALGTPVDDAHEVVLEPESLIVVDDPYARIDAHRPLRASADTPLRDLAALATHGRIDARTYAVAFDAKRMLARRMHELVLQLELLANCGALTCRIRLATGTRGHASFPDPAADRTLAPLAVRVHPDSPRRGPWTLRLIGSQASRDYWILADGSDSVVGELGVRPPRFELEPLSRDGAWTFETLILGDDYTYALFDHASGAHATGTLRHTGEPIELRLRDGCVIAGRIAVPDGSALPRSIDVTVQWNDPPSREHGRRVRSLWNTRTHYAVPLAPDGSFEVASLDASSNSNGGRALLSVQVDAEELASGHRELEVARGRRHDLGAIELAAAEPEFLIVRAGSIWPTTHFRTWASAAGVRQEVIRLVQRPGDELCVRTAQPIDAREIALQWITESRDREYLFVERDGAAYRPAKLERRHVELAIQSGADPDQFWRLALCWRDACVDLDEVRATQGGEVLVRAYNVPEGTRLSWTPFRQLNAGVSPPLGPSQSVALDAQTSGSAPRAVLR